MSEKDEDKITRLMAEYQALMHAVQSGIAMRMSLDASTEPGTIIRDESLQRALKHLRVGVDGCKSDQGGLAALLISKGIFTEMEYFEYMVAFARREKESYERMISERLGRKVTLA